MVCNYRKTSCISRTKSQNLNVSHLLLQWSLPNLLKPGVKLRMKMLLEQRRQAMLQLHLSYQQFYCLLRCDFYSRFYGNCVVFFVIYVVPDLTATLPVHFNSIRNHFAGHAVLQDAMETAHMTYDLIDSIFSLDVGTSVGCRKFVGVRLAGFKTYVIHGIWEF